MTTALATRDNNTPAEFDIKNGGMQLRNMAQVFKAADFMSKSGLVPQQYRNKPADIVVAWQKGAELGLSPTQSLDGIAVINGRATLWGEATTAVVLASGLMLEHKCWHTGSIKEGNLTAHCRVRRKGMEPAEFEFGQVDAEMAGLWGKGTYKSYPKDMLMWKAKARAYRTMFADCLKGIMVREDMDDGFRRRVDNTATSIEDRTPPMQSDPLLDELENDEPEIVHAVETPSHLEEEHHASADVEEAGFLDEVDDEPPVEEEPQPLTWTAAVDALKAISGCDTDTAEQVIADAVLEKWNKDVADLTTKQIELVIKGVEDGKIAVPS